MQVKNQNIPAFQGRNVKIEWRSLNRGLKSNPGMLDIMWLLEPHLAECAKNNGVKVTIKGPSSKEENIGLEIVATTTRFIRGFWGFGKKRGTGKRVFPKSFVDKVGERKFIRSVFENIVSSSAAAYMNLGEMGMKRGIKAKKI